MMWLAQNPERDLALGSVLHDVEEAELRMIDWDGLAQRIIVAIHQSVSVSTWYEVMSNWWRVVLPLAIAASLAALVVLGAIRSGRMPSAPVTSTSSVLDVLVLRQPGDLRDALLGFSDAETFLTEALEGGR